MDLKQDLGAPSTRFAHEHVKIKRPRRATASAWRKAPPHPHAKHFGPRTAVTLTLTALRGSEAWIEVRSSTGRWFVNYDAGVGDLVQQIIRGGHWVEQAGPSTT